MASGQQSIVSSQWKELSKNILMALEDLRVYNVAMEIGENAWTLIDRWSYFQKDTIGKQFVKAADSIAANISEGYGRYHFKDSKKLSLLCPWIYL